MDRTLRSQADSSCAVMKSCQAELISSVDGVTVPQMREMGGLLRELILSSSQNDVGKPDEEAGRWMLAERVTAV